MFDSPLAHLLWATAMVVADIAANLVAPGISLFLAQVVTLTLHGGIYVEGVFVVAFSVLIFSYLLVLLESWRNSLKLSRFVALRIISDKVLRKGNSISLVTAFYFLCVTDMPSFEDETFYTPFMLEATTMLFIVLKFINTLDPPNFLKKE